MDRISSAAAIINGLYMLSICGFNVLAGGRLRAGFWRHFFVLSVIIPCTIMIISGLYPSLIGPVMRTIKIAMEAVGISLVAYFVFRRDRLLVQSTVRPSNG